MTSTVYVIQVSIAHAEWNDIYSYRRLANACRVFEDLTTDSPLTNHSFRLVKRVTTEEVLDLWGR